MTLRLRNTLTRRVEPLEPSDGQRVRMYTCGPTVYRHVHVGNLRTFLLADFIRRALLYHGIPVLHVKNITDVGHMRDEHHDHGGDRVLVQAQLEGRSAAELAAHYEADFHADEALVNILPAHVFPRATEHVEDMIRIAERLEDLGYAYRAPDGTLYYDVARFDGYGRLSGNTLDHLRAGHRGPVHPGKRDHADFALWKVAEPGRAEFSWPTPRWGTGFPGWHLECSAMSLRYLGEQFDLHTGGVDNVFPHHEDEIAQSEPVTGGTPARIWVHGEHLLTAGRKMAKSAGNFVRVTELAEAGIEPLALRYLALTARYGHKLHASDTSLRAAQAALNSLRARLRALGPPPTDGPWAAPPALLVHPAGDRPTGQAGHSAGHGTPDDPPFPLTDRAHAPSAPLSSTGRALHERIVAALDDDLDLPVALAAVRDTLRAELSADEKRWLVLDADLLLGLGLSRSSSAQEPASEHVERLTSERARARAARDYATADALREELRRLGVTVVDERAGEPVTRRRGS
ncbi:MAG TPA: cysteine--tRNA ligase [Candidatus Limnocylindria bacterium]|nr:cysteine--tRNA ligase [Candidatus Limnocylindria bacterium]